MSPQLIVGVFGLGALQLASLYEQAAPSLQEMREMEVGDDKGRQHLMDANILIGSYALIISAVAYYATGSVMALLLFTGIVSLAAFWRYMVLYSERF